MSDNAAYIMSNYNRNVFYTGVTSDIWHRVLEHKTGQGCEFSARYKTTYLVFFEEYKYIDDAIAREKQLKNWKREWKINLIKEDNPEMKDLSEDWYTKEEIDEFLESYKDESWDLDRS